MEKLHRSEAREFLIRYHFAPNDVPGVFDRLGCIQYDPLNPIGRNVDLVLQARVPGYRVDTWHDAVYRDRLAYDAWDKQACLVPVTDWPYRAVYHRHFREAWRERVFDPHPTPVQTTLAELATRGPLSSLDFNDRTPIGYSGSWYGPSLIKHVLKALWDSGQIVTHHRESGRHVYATPDQVLPQDVLDQTVTDAEAVRFLILRRHQSMGLLRPTAPRDLWNIPVDAETRKKNLGELRDEGLLIPVKIGGKEYHTPAHALESTLNTPTPEGIRFLAPLDSLIWDRNAIRDIFEFEYVWEVYKPKPQRRWGYYVLPILHGTHLVGRLDSRRDGPIWRVESVWWEDSVEITPPLFDAFTEAAGRFLEYLGTDSVEPGPGIDRRTRTALKAARRSGEV